MRFFSTLAILSSLAATSHAALVYHTDFENDTVGALASGGSVVGGTVSGGGSSIVNLGTGVATNFMGGMAMDLGNVWDSTSDTWLETGFDLGAAGINGGAPYTMAAWINQNATGGNQHVFGSEGSGTSLHLGVQGTSYWSGHWGDDASGGTATAGDWDYVVWTNDGAGNQQIFVNGVAAPVASGAGGGANNFGNELIIGGTRNDNSRDFRGLIAGVAVWDEVLTPADQKTFAAFVALAPEPSRTTLLGLAAMAMILRRRR